MAARAHGTTESLGTSTTTATAWSTKAAVTFTPDASSSYLIMFSAVGASNSTTVSGLMRLQNVTDTVTYWQSLLESKDPLDLSPQFGCYVYTSGASPTSHTFEIQYSAEVAATTMTIKEARISWIKLGADDEFVVQAGETEAAGDDTTWHDALALTFTPATTGDYMVLASGILTTNGGGDHYAARLLDDSSTARSIMVQRLFKDATDLIPCGGGIKRNLSAASKTFKLQFQNTAGLGDTIGIQQMCIVALRLDDFANAYYAETRARSTSTLATWVDGNTLTQTPVADDHLVIGLGIVDGASTTVSCAMRFSSGGTAMTDSRNEAVSLTGGQYFAWGHFGIETLAASSKTWINQATATTAGTATGRSEMAICVIQLSDPVTSTPVNVTRQLIWDLRAVLAATRQLIWNVSTPVNKSPQLIWNVSTKVAQTKQLIWDVRAVGGKTQQLVWDVRAVGGKTSQLIWNVSAPVSPGTRQLVWNVSTKVTQTKQLVWDVRTVAGKTSQLIWNVSAPIGGTRQLVWDVRTVAGLTRQLVWDVLALGVPVAATRQLVWDVRTVAPATRQLIWNVSTKVTVNRQLIWNVSSLVGATKQLVWDLRTVAPATRQLIWNARATAGKTNQLIWNVSTKVPQTKQLVWNVSTKVTQTKQLVWDVRVPVGQARQLVWNVSTSVNRIRQLVWDLRTVAGVTRQLIWDVLANATVIGRSFGLVWNLRATVGASRQLVWSLRAPVAGTRQLVWNVSTRVSLTRQLVWNVSTPIGRTRTLVWDLRAPLGRTVILVWNVSSMVGKTRTLVWNVQTIGATLPYGWTTVLAPYAYVARSPSCPAGGRPSRRTSPPPSTSRASRVPSWSQAGSPTSRSTGSTSR